MPCVGTVLIKKLLLVVAGLVVAFFALGFYLVATEDPAQARKREQLRNLDRMCEQMMSDSALGNERRTTRSICDEAKAQAQRKP